MITVIDINNGKNKSVSFKMCERKDVNVSLNDSNSIKSKDINTGLIDVLGGFYSLLGHFLKWLHETQLRKHTVIVEKKKLFRILCEIHNG